MPAEAHPDRHELGRFVAGELASARNRRVVRHLLAGCESCRRTTAEIWRPSQRGDLAGVVERALRRTTSLEMTVERERSEAETLLTELGEQSPSRQLLLILNSRRYCNWFLCEELINRALRPASATPGPP